MRRHLVFAYRLGTLAVVVWAVHGALAPAEDPRFDLDAVRGLFPAAARVEAPRVPGGWSRVRNAEGIELGSVVSTSPTADRITGYAGPVPVLIAIRPDGRVSGLQLLANRESPEYVEEVVASGMLDRWRGLSAAQAAAADVDTVSGATWTSRAIREGVRFRLSQLAGQPGAVVSAAAGGAGWKDAVTIALVAAGLALCFTRSKWHPRWRVLLAVAVVAWLGFVTGSMISQTLVFGWVGSPPAPLERPGLVVLALAALATPALSGRPFYCTYLCPHGAAQELIGRLSPWRRRVPRGLARWLTLIPGAALMAALGLVYSGAPVGWLSSMEPFGAYLFTGAAALALAAVGLALSVILKRPWCRFGCATGALLRFLQRPRGAAGLGRADIVAGAAAALAVLWRVVGR